MIQRIEKNRATRLTADCVLTYCSNCRTKLPLRTKNRDKAVKQEGREKKEMEQMERMKRGQVYRRNVDHRARFAKGETATRVKLFIMSCCKSRHALLIGIVKLQRKAFFHAEQKTKVFKHDLICSRENYWNVTSLLLRVIQWEIHFIVLLIEKRRIR